MMVLPGFLLRQRFENVTRKLERLAPSLSLVAGQSSPSLKCTCLTAGSSYAAGICYEPLLKMATYIIEPSAKGGTDNN